MTLPLLFILDIIVSASWFSYVMTSNSHFHCVLYISINRTILRFKIRLIGLVETNHQQRRQCLQCDCVSWIMGTEAWCYGNKETLCDNSIRDSGRCVRDTRTPDHHVHVHVADTLLSSGYSLLHTVVNLHALTWTSTVLAIITTCK